jgi:enoyl-CoA hydratase
MLVNFEKRGAVAIVTLNRPAAMNALSVGLRSELAKAFIEIDKDDNVKVVVLTGEGDRAFTAGLDLKELSSDTSDLGAASSQNSSLNPVYSVESCKKPVIGAINGVAITGGFELALACDILIAGENARFADTHARIGIMPGWGLSQKLSRAVGISRAKELSLSGRFLDARTACEWGLVNRVVPQSDLLPRSLELADEIAAIDPNMVQAYKSLINEGFALSFGEGLRMESGVSSAVNGRVSADEISSRREQVMERGRNQTANLAVD